MTRVSSTVDVGRLAAAVSQPGIDPRTWVATAVVTAVGVDPGHGHFVDVVLLGGAAEHPMTARVGAPDAGAGFGSYFPIAVDDEVLIGIPDGNPAAGAVVLARLWSAADPPPAEASQHPGDVLLVRARPGSTVRIITEGAGSVVVEARGSGHVVLGDESATRGSARLADQIKLHLAELQNCLDTRYQLRPSPPPLELAAFAPGVSGEITTASDKVRSS